MNNFTRMKFGLIASLLLLMQLSYGQVTIAKQSFEASGDTWSVTIDPAAYNTEDPIGDNGPVNGDEDVWDDISAFTGDISGPSDGSLFWGMQDLDNGNGGGSFDHTIETDWLDISAFNSVQVSFDYYTVGFEASDDLAYQIAYDMGAFGSEIDLNDNTGAWTEVSISVPTSATSVKLKLIARQNGGSDYGGWDNLEVTGVSATETAVQFASATYSLAEDGLFVDVCASITNPDAVIATTVDVALDGGSSTATNGTDYDDGAGTPMAIAFPVTLTFPANSSADQCLTIYISNDDSDVEGNETIELMLENASGGSSANIAGITATTVTIFDNDFAPVDCPSGTETQSQGFEGGGSWTYSVSGNSQALPCSSGDDLIGEASTVGTGGDAVSANSGSQFFAVRDIQGDCATFAGVDLEFATFSATALTEGNYAVSFDYNAFEWDTGDNISYDLQVNSSSISSGDAVSGGSNFSTSGWETQTINFTMTDGDDLDFSINLDQNGDGDWGGVDNVVLCFISVLPVNLTSFNVYAEEASTRLKWQTAGEENNAHYLIQRSTDGREFNTIARVEGAGNSAYEIDYEFVDNKPQVGWNYYRLEQVDFDGGSSFFGPRGVRFESTEMDAPQVWPVPTGKVLEVELPDSDLSWTLEVFSMNGQLLLQQQLEEKSIRTSFDVSTLPAGSYFLRWTNGQNIGQSRFVKS